MVTWQRRCSLRSRRIMSVTALGRSSLSFFPLITGPPLLLLPRRRSWPYRGGAMLNFALTAFCELRIRHVLRSSPRASVDGIMLVAERDAPPMG
jgi:hypothetical protein